MGSRMKDDALGTTRIVKGLMDNIEYYVFNLKEPEHTSKIMSTHGCLAEQGEETSRRISSGHRKGAFHVHPVLQQSLPFPPHCR